MQSRLKKIKAQPKAAGAQSARPAASRPAPRTLTQQQATVQLDHLRRMIHRRHQALAQARPASPASPATAAAPASSKGGYVEKTSARCLTIRKPSSARGGTATSHRKASCKR